MKKIKTVLIVAVLLWTGLVIKGQGCVNFTEVQDNIGIVSETFGVSLADFDGDGYKDVVTIHAYDDIEIYFNNGTGDGTFNTTTHHYGDTSRARFGVQVIDVDSDGDMDFLTVPFYDESWGIEVWKNNGDGIFSLSQDNIGSHTRGEELAIGDLNNDGYTDIFYPSQWEIQIFLNDGTGYFVPNGQDEIVASSGVDAALADFDGDGDLDAAVAKNTSSAKQIWVNDGAGNFTDSGQELTTEQTKGVDVGDIDNDGDMDIFYACGYDELQVWMNDGLGNFMPGMDLSGLSAMSTEVILIDLNFDGNLDIVTSKNILINDIANSGTFLNEEYIGGDHDIEVADVNNDGFLDIYAPSFSDQSGDAVYTFNTPTINDEEVALCYSDSLLVINNWQTEAGIYLEYADCEEYTRYDLSFYDEINTNVTFEDGTFTAEATEVVYQWLYCIEGNTEPIVGENEQSYTPTEDGDYAVMIINDGDCSAISDCQAFVYVNTSNIIENNIAIYPNPTTGQLTINSPFEVGKGDVQLIITDITGKITQQLTIQQFTNLTIDLSNQPSGIYFIKIQTENEIITKKILKN